MDNTNTEPTSDQLVHKSEADKAADYGITTSRITYYHYRAYRYSNLKDAIAEAKRDRDRRSD